jgi:hypothetical protein
VEIYLSGNVEASKFDVYGVDGETLKHGKHH